jgi:hypothetical protein
MRRPTTSGVRRGTASRTIATGSTTSKPSVPEGAVIIYGRGDSLGDFKVFADDLRDDLKPKFSHIVVTNIEEKDDLVDYLANTKFGFLIKELHIMSHAFGGGLALGYGSPDHARARESAYVHARSQVPARNVTLPEVLAAEEGILFTQDLVTSTYTSKAKLIHAQFALGASVKLWGCNAGIENWTYSDDDWTGDSIPDIYWSLLNSSVPQPSIAQAIADYLKLPTYAAKSGSHIEVRENGKWITSQQYKNKHGKWPNPAKVAHRLAPDRGAYVLYSPN